MNPELEKDLKIFKLFKEGNVDEAEKMMKKYNKNILETSEDGWNWLHQMLMGIKKNYIPENTIRYFINHGVSVNAQDCYGMTPLHYAMRSKNAEAAKILLGAGANPNIPDRDLVTPLAYINGMPERLDLLEVMLKNGGDMHFFNGDHGILEGIKKYRNNDPRFHPVIEMMEKFSLKNSP